MFRLPALHDLRRFDSGSASRPAKFGDLPDWDLSDLYRAPDAPEIARDFDQLDRACASFAADYQGKLAALDAPGLLNCVRRYEKIDMVAGRLMSYRGPAVLSDDTLDSRARQIHVRCPRPRDPVATTPLVFFTLETEPAR
jgi:oligoendopeptidase F